VNVPLWVSELAAEFWRLAGAEEPFPRNLHAPISASLPLTIKVLPKLRLSSIKSWLETNGIACTLGRGDRRLRGALAAQNGHAIAFLDGTDPEDEQRFSLAHELAHFLRDYWRPSNLAINRLGPQALDVLDGIRPPTAEERLQSLLRYVPTGLHLHLLDRDDDGLPRTLSIASAEEDADRLAYELLAPIEHVLAAVNGSPSRTSVQQVLASVFGLPKAHAGRYADLLFPSAPAADPLLGRLRAANSAVEHGTCVRNLSGS
jgi:hypothetical protein